ncbi:flagellar motor switch protein FliM [Saccharothrix violaceirubra]|uniref:Flagellar motor switch protein FliM n=1 Tax=Saccharothrix violaceirubra TaxID=413306 RepID=A0A7W7WZ33_9PSEU|nr:flagellar motor switch protein FliM [Saccharothrix violaceirubra]MBB4968373.1 flagellar motor switch protein FliM [Saccharothrix violaceirubra]
MSATPLTPGTPRSRSAKTAGLVTDGRASSTYDFLRPANLPREHLRILQIAYETFAHRLSVLLTSNLRVVCRVAMTGIEQVSTRTVLTEQTDDLIAVSIGLSPLSGAGVLVFPRELAMVWIDHMLGGTGGGEQPRRTLSDIETPLVRELLTDALAELGAAYAEFAAVDLVLGVLEYDPQLVAVGGPADALVKASFEIAVGTAASELTFSVPVQAVQPSLQRRLDSTAISAGEQAARAAARDLLTESLSDVPVEVAVRFSPARMRSEDLLDLRVGDVVSLDHPVDRPLVITTAGGIFGRAVPTARGTRLTCQVVATESEESRA